MRARCPLCGNGGPGWSLYAKVPGADEAFELLRCPDCGFGWTHPPVPPERIASWYPPEYYGEESIRFHWAVEMLVRLFRLRRARTILRLIEPGPVLDVGCGRGFLLAYLRRAGCAPYGLELSETAAAHAKKRLELPVHIGSLESSPLEPGSLHAVVFWHSLEHIADPLDALRRAHTLLKPGGLLVVAVPNSESAQAAWLGRNWFHLDIPRHYAHFGRRSLELALIRSGFKPAEIAHFSLEQNLFGWVQSLQNAMGLPFNFLYEWMKRRERRLALAASRPFASLFAASLLAPLLPLSAALTLWEAWRRRGGTIEVYAFKEPAP